MRFKSQEQYDKWMAARFVHGGYSGGKETPLHYVWRSMHARCNNPKHKSYSDYGGRGIAVCPQWESYEVFAKDVGDRPSKVHSLDRIDNSKGYEPGNCRWVLRSQQQKNKRTTVIYTDGVFSGTLVECANKLGISKELAHWRFKTWNTFEKGISWRKRQREQ